jgi:hypothetical protein
MRSHTSICGTTATTGVDGSGALAGSAAAVREASISAPSGSCAGARGGVAAGAAAATGADGLAAGPCAVAAVDGAEFPAVAAVAAAGSVGALCAIRLPSASVAGPVGAVAAAGDTVGDDALPSPVGSVLHAAAPRTTAVAASARSEVRTSGSPTIERQQAKAAEDARERGAGDVGPGKVTSTSTVRSDSQRRARV